MKLDAGDRQVHLEVDCAYLSPLIAPPAWQQAGLLVSCFQVGSEGGDNGDQRRVSIDLSETIRVDEHLEDLTLCAGCEPVM
jgi:hypothetical protein